MGPPIGGGDPERSRQARKARRRLAHNRIIASNRLRLYNSSNTHIIRGPRDAFWPKAKKRRDSTAPSAFKRSGRAEAARSGLAWVCMCDST